MPSGKAVFDNPGPGFDLLGAEPPTGLRHARIRSVE